MICSSSESVPLKSNVIARGRVRIGPPSSPALAAPGPPSWLGPPGGFPPPVRDPRPGAGPSPPPAAAQAAGVCLVGLGVILVRGLRGHADIVGTAFALGIASTIAAYTLVDKHGIQHAGPIPYLELGMTPAAVGFTAMVVARRGRSSIRSELRPAPIVAGITQFGAYVLVLAALARASAASVAAVRETSVVIATAAAAPLLRERVSWSRLAGAAVVVTGVVLVSVG